MCPRFNMLQKLSMPLVCAIPRTYSATFNELTDCSAFMERFTATSNNVALQTFLQDERSRVGYR